MRARVASIALFALLAACGKDAEHRTDALSVGVLLPMSGGTATYGRESWNGIRIAADEIRAKDPSFAFSLELADEQSKKELAGGQTKRLVENNGAQIVVGSVASSNTMAAAVVCKDGGVPLLTPASTNDTLTDDAAKYGKDLFRVCYKDSFQGTMLGRFAWNTLKAKKAVALIDRAQAYSVGLAEQFTKEFTRLGGTVVSESYTSEDKDFSTLVQKVAGLSPDVILISGYYEEAGRMIRISKEAWKGKPVIGGDGLDSEVLLEHIREADAQVYFSSHFVASDDDPAVQAFVGKYRDRFHGEVPGAMAALGYDAMYAVYEAAKRAKAAAPDGKYSASGMADALRGLSFTGVTGKIEIGPDRTPVKSIVIVKAEGTFKFVEKISP